MSDTASERGHVSVWRASLVILASLGAAGVVIFWQSRLISRQRSQLAIQAGQIASLRQSIDRTVPPAPEKTAIPPPNAPLRLGPPASVSVSQESYRTLLDRAERLRESLAQSNTRIAHLENNISALQSRIDSAAAENRRLGTEIESGRENSAAAAQTIADLRAELKSNTDRAAQVEAANAKLKQEVSSRKQSYADAGETVAALQGIFHRREMYLNDILRRYREITEQYRSMSGVLDSRRDREAAPISNTEISRIQNAIALAEEDLKQIYALNAQAAALQKKLPNH